MSFSTGAALHLPLPTAKRGRSTNGASAPLPPFASQAILVADQEDLAQAVATHVKKATGLSCYLRGYQDGPAPTTQGIDLLMVLLATTRQDLERAREFVQEISLRKLGYVVVLVTVESCCGQVLRDLEERVGNVLLWPQDAVTLAQLVRNHQPRPRTLPVTQYREGTREDQIARRLLAQTPSLLPLVEKLALAAEHDVTVLLTGETGTGKTFVARLIHDYSPRADERFLTVPCGALSANLVESEFFGHVKGAFTGADRPKIGKFEAAGQGTLLLDEIDALPMEQQANLLRVVETGEYEPVGSTETQYSGCRLLVASNRNLKEETERGRFRQDLYYRFNVMSFHLPSLRERIEDVAPLVRSLAAQFTVKFRKDLYEISPETMSLLESYPWPGNVRELENAVQHAVLVSQGDRLLPEHLPEVITAQQAAGSGCPATGATLMRNREVAERSVIERTLANHGYSRARTASELGISRVTLYKKMKKYGLMDSPHSDTFVA